MQPVEYSNPDSVDYGWAMRMAFVATILVGSPIVVVLSVNARLQMWSTRVEFAIRIGAVIWFVTAVVLFVYVRRINAGDDGAPPGTELDIDIDMEN